MDAKLRSWCLVFIIFCFLIWSAAATDLMRPYDPIVIQGKDLPSFVGSATSEIFVYSFNNGSWTQIPFQIDETDGGGYFAVHNGVLNLDDEICFMAADMGDSAADYHWISDYASMAYQRYQICASDTSYTPAKKTYAYVYRSTTLSNVFTPYMQYIPPTTGSADTIKSIYYIFAHDTNSIPSHLQIFNGTDYSPDFLDRWKIRFEGKLLGMFPFSETEDSALQDTLILVHSGPVRVIRQGFFKIFINGNPAGKLLSLTMVFYPHSAQITLLNEELPSTMGITKMRQSVDYNQHIAGAQFHWKNAHNIPVNGEEDTLGDQTMTVPGINWYMLQSTYGTVATVIKNDPIDNATQYLFYLDDSSHANGILRGDTGDLQTFGESGVLILSDPGYSIETSDKNLFATFYYLSDFHTHEFGDTISSYIAHPLWVSVIPRTNEVIPVELASFQALLHKEGVELKWQTASETNNYGFQIQRRTGTQNSWQLIGFVRGQGTSSEAHDYRYLDTNPAQGLNYYRLRQLDTDGKCMDSQEVCIEVQLPNSLELHQNHPNPFNPGTEIGIRIPNAEEKTTLTIYNILGQKIRSLVDTKLTPGYHRIYWDGTDDRGQPVGAGIYLYQLELGNDHQVRKMVKVQ